MKKEHTYVECTGCKWQLEQNLMPDRDWDKIPCPRCKNTRLMIDPKEHLCNMCGEGMCPNIVVPSGKWISDSPHGLFEASVVGGYESYHLMDMTRYTFSFCEKCLRSLFLQCKIPPRLNELGIEFVDDNLASFDREERDWQDEVTSYEYRIWKDAGGHHEAYMNRKCNAIKDCPNAAAYTILHNDTEFTEETLCEKHKDHKYSNSTLTKFIPNVLKTFL